MDSRLREKEDAAAAVDAELEFHFAEVVEGLVKRGWLEGAARQEALRRFGDRVCYRETLFEAQPTDRALEVVDRRRHGRNV
jgi:hypothetical protein